MLRIASVFAILFALTACDGEDNTRRYEGAGYSLYSESHTPAATRELAKYFDQLCGQAAIGTVKVNPNNGQRSFFCPPALSSTHYSKLMQAGFNDIDLRCDQYLGWIDRKRIEALSYRRGAGAIEALIGAGLRIDDAGPNAFASLLAVFSFARDIYDASHTSLLAALESSTIKTIVYKRQKAFRAAANAHSGKHASRESVVFALRNYLLICTPQTIVLDANTFSRDPSAGSPKALQEDFTERFQALSPVSATATFGSSGNVAIPQGQTCKGRDKVFSDNPESYSCSDIRTAQGLLCFTPERGLDGSAGPATTAAIREFELAQLGNNQTVTDPKLADGLLSATEFRALASAGCLNNEGNLYRSVYERSVFGQEGDDINRLTIIEALNFCFADQDKIPADATMDNTILRARVNGFRTRFDIEPHRGEVITRDLFSQIGDAQTLCAQ